MHTTITHISALSPSRGKTNFPGTPPANHKVGQALRARRALFLFAAVLTLPFRLHAEQQPPRMELALSATSIYPGEAVQLSIHVQGYHPGLGQPDLGRLPAKVDFLGQQDRSQQSVRIINGVRQVTGFSGRTFTYRVEPHTTGALSLSSITMEGGNGTIRPVNDLAIEVRPIPQQDHVKMWVVAPTHHVVPDESFEITLFIRIRKLTPPFHEHSPLSRNGTPHLHVPYLDIHPAEGLQSENITQLLQRMLVREGESFRINDRIIGRDPFGGMFGRDQAALFQLPKRTDPEDDRYILYELKSTWSADREGDYTFGPVRFRGSVITHVNPQGEIRERDIYALSEPVTVLVRNPPVTGRPATFVGASGTGYEVHTELDTQICQTGDPVTLTLDITGDGPAHRIRSPRPETLSPLERDFRLQPEPSRSESIPGGRRFSYLIRPRQAGTLEIPGLEIAYFDLASRTYRTITSDPLPIRVNPGEELEREAITGADRGRIRISVSAAPGDLPPAPFLFTPSTPASSSFHPALHLPILLAGPLFLILALLAKWLPQHVPALKARIERKQVHTTARAQLQAESPDAVAILREYLANALDPAFRKADAHKLQLILDQYKVPPETRDRMLQLLTHDAYTGQDSTIAASTVREMIDTVAECVSHKHRSRKRPAAAARILFLLAAGSLAASALAIGVSSFEERRTNLLLLKAQDTSDFLLAADALADRVDRNEQSPAILYNLGTALLMSDQPLLALPILERAERRGAPAWNVRRNMLVARRMITQDPTLQLPWIRKPLFWHFRLSLSARITITAACATLVWILATVRWFFRKQARLLAPGIIILLMLLTSLAASLYAELQDTQDWPAQRRQLQRILQIQQQGDDA